MGQWVGHHVTHNGTDRVTDHGTHETDHVTGHGTVGGTSCDRLWPHITISQEQEIITGLFHFQPELTSYG